jgi:hypothetical protein
MVAANQTISPLSANYDVATDVLRLIVGKPQHVDADRRDGGLNLEFSQETNEPCSVTVIGYRHNLWNERMNELASVVSKHLGLGRRYIRSIIPAVVVQAEMQLDQGGQALEPQKSPAHLGAR